MPTPAPPPYQREARPARRVAGSYSPKSHQDHAREDHDEEHQLDHALALDVRDERGVLRGLAAVGRDGQSRIERAEPLDRGADDPIAPVERQARDGEGDEPGEAVGGAEQGVDAPDRAEDGAPDDAQNDHRDGGRDDHLRCLGADRFAGGPLLIDGQLHQARNQDEVVIDHRAEPGDPRQHVQPLDAELKPIHRGPSCAPMPTRSLAKRIGSRDRRRTPIRRGAKGASRMLRGSRTPSRPRRPAAAPSRSAGRTTIPTESSSATSGRAIEEPSGAQK